MAADLVLTAKGSRYEDEAPARGRVRWSRQQSIPSHRGATCIISGLGLQALHPISGYADAVVQSIFPALPELHQFRRNEIAAPTRRDGNLLAVGEAGGHLPQLVEQGRS